MFFFDSDDRIQVLKWCWNALQGTTREMFLIVKIALKKVKWFVLLARKKAKNMKGLGPQEEKNIKIYFF